MSAKDLHRELEGVARILATDCNEVNIPHYHLEITISCRPLTGEYTIEYSLGEDSYSPKTVGRDLAEISYEWKRRWARDKAEHAKLLTLYASEATNAEEVE